MTGVDFIDIPLQEARQKAAEAGLAIDFYLGDISDLSFLKGRFDLAIDVGCAHSLDDEQWRRHYRELKRLLRPGGIYLLYARLREEEWGLAEPFFFNLVDSGFAITRIERGMTHMDDGRSFPSAWYWLRRTAQE